MTPSLRKSPLVAALGAVFIATLAVCAPASAADNPDALRPMDQGGLHLAEAKCGAAMGMPTTQAPAEGKCGAAHAAQMPGGKCGAAMEPPATQAPAEGKCGAAKSDPAASQAKCGSGK